ncbi:MAG: ArsR/SmtB family transcription factor [Thermoproteota archaeon]
MRGKRNLSENELKLLKIILSEGPCSVYELSRKVIISRTAVQKNLENLEKEGYVTSEKTKEKREKVKYSLTLHGFANLGFLRKAQLHRSF